MNGRLTPETDALARAWRDWDDSEAAEQPKSFRELSWELERQRDEARELARDLRDALELALEHAEPGVWVYSDDPKKETLLSIALASAITKAKEVLP
jgi:hypothetical protein